MFTLSFTHFQWFYTRCGDSSRFLLTSVLKLTIKSHLRDNKRRIYGRIYIICMRLELTIRIHEKDIKPKKLMHFENYSGWIYMVQKHKHLIYLQETYHNIIWSSTKLKLVSSTTSNVWYIQVRLEKLWKSMKCLEFKCYGCGCEKKPKCWTIKEIIYFIVSIQIYHLNGLCRFSAKNKIFNYCSLIPLVEIIIYRYISLVIPLCCGKL